MNNLFIFRLIYYGFIVICGFTFGYYLGKKTKKEEEKK